MNIETLEKTTELAKEAHTLRRQGKEFTIIWEIMDKARSFKAGDRFCRLCILEMYTILYKSDENTLNGLK